MTPWLRLCVALALSACGPTAPGGGGGGDDDDGADIDGGGGPGPGTPDARPGTDEFVDAAVCDQTVPITVDVIANPPDMLLVVDKSGSMADPLDIFMPFQTKWNVMRNALNSVVGAKQDLINFGLMLFPSDDMCGPGVVSAGVAPHNAAAISSALGATNANGSTPTHLSIGAAHAYFDGIAVNPNGRFALLATDGLPNCAANPEDPSLSQTVAEISALHAAGIPTYVLGFGSAFTADPSALNMMAAAGGTGMYYSATSPAELQAALDLVSSTVIPPPCSYALDSVPNDPSLLAVTFDGVPVPRDSTHTTGWDYDPATNTITFYGSTCDQLESGSVMSVHVDYGCGGPVIG